MACPPTAFKPMVEQPGDSTRGGGGEVGRPESAPAPSAEADMLRVLSAWVRLIPDHFPDHPAIKWYEGLTNAIHDARVLPARGIFHRFRRGRDVAYLWAGEGGVFLSPWHPVGGRGREVRQVGSFDEALDL